MLCQAKKQSSFEVNTVLCSFKTEIFNLWNFKNWTKSTLFITYVNAVIFFIHFNQCLFRRTFLTNVLYHRTKNMSPRVGVKFCRNCKLKTVNYHSCYFKINVSSSSPWWGSDTKQIFTCTLFSCWMMYLCMMLLTI